MSFAIVTASSSYTMFTSDNIISESLIITLQFPSELLSIPQILNEPKSWIWRFSALLAPLLCSNRPLRVPNRLQTISTWFLGNSEVRGPRGRSEAAWEVENPMKSPSDPWYIAYQNHVQSGSNRSKMENRRCDSLKIIFFKIYLQGPSNWTVWTTFWWNFHHTTRRGL